MARDGRPVPLIPKYFDLLHLLVVRRARRGVEGRHLRRGVERRHRHRRRARAGGAHVRRALDDDPKAPRFIRTVSRHGYQFVAADLSSKRPTAGAADAARPAATPPPPVAAGAPDAVAGAIDRLMEASRAGAAAEAEARQAAGDLVGLDAAAAVAEVRARPGHARALAYLRDARWDDGGPGRGAAWPATRAGAHRAGDRAAPPARRRRRWSAAARAARLASARWSARSPGPCGGGVLMLAPGSSATPLSALALAILGAGAGTAGTAAVVLGVAGAELVARSQRGAAVVAAAVAERRPRRRRWPSWWYGRSCRDYCAWARWQLPARSMARFVAGAVALGYAITTRSARGGSLPAPRGWSRGAVLAATSLCGAAAGAAARHPRSSARRRPGQPDRPSSRAARRWRSARWPASSASRRSARSRSVLLAAFEGAAFGLAIGLSLTRRPAAAPILIQRSRRRSTPSDDIGRSGAPRSSAPRRLPRRGSQRGHRDRPPTLRHRRDLPGHQRCLGHPRHLARRPQRRVRLPARTGSACVVGRTAAASWPRLAGSTARTSRSRSSRARTRPERSRGPKPARTSCVR